MPADSAPIATLVAADVLPSESSLEDSRARLLSIPTVLGASLVEREVLLLDLMTAFVAQEHLSMIGPPGVAKSLAARVFSAIVCRSLEVDAEGGPTPLSYFEYLMTPFTEPNELFGPVDIEAFKKGAYRRMTAGMLPTAELCFLDEAFKANSAIMNSLLTIFNERLYHEGPNKIRTPLRMAILASNEPPAKDLSALWDRCLVRHSVTELKDAENVTALYAGTLPAAPTEPLATVADADALWGLSFEVTMSKTITDNLIKLNLDLSTKGIKISDRRKGQIGHWLRVVAALEGSLEVRAEHFDRLRPLLWSRYEDQTTVDALVEPYAAAWRTTLRQVSAAVDATLSDIPADNAKLTDLTTLAGWVKDLKDQKTTLIAYHGRVEVDAVIKKIDSALVRLKAAVSKVYGE